MVVGTSFLGAPVQSDLNDGSTYHFLNLKLVDRLNLTTLTIKNFLHSHYSFVIPNADDTAKRLAPYYN